MRLIKSKFAYQDEEYDDEIADIISDRFAEADKPNRIKNEDKQEQRGEEPLDQLDFGEFEALKELGFENDQLAGLSSTEAKFIIAAFMEDEEAAMRAYKPRRIRGLRRSRVSPTERIQRLKYRRKNRFKLRRARKVYYRKNKHQIKTRKARKSRMGTPRTKIDRRYHYTYKSGA